MKVKLTKVGSTDVLKLVLSENVCSVAELHRLACEKFNVPPEDFTLQYLDPDFKEFINVTDIYEITDLMCIRLCHKDGKTNSVASASADDGAAASLELRKVMWPKVFELPAFDGLVELFLRSAEETFSKNGTVAVVPRDVKVKLLDAIANKIYSFTAYASGEQINQVAQSLVERYPSLQCKTAPNGWEAWANAIAFKMGNFRSKMRKLGCEEVQLNSDRRSKFSRPSALPSAANIKKPRKGEVNFLPNMPATETVDSLEEYRTWMTVEMHKSEPDLVTVNRYMALTFAMRRKEVTQGALTCTVMEWWPALFTSAQVGKFHIVLINNIVCTLCFKKRNPFIIALTL